MRVTARRFVSLLLAATAGGAAQRPAALTFEPDEIAPGVHVFVSSERGAGNSVAILGTEAALVVDSSLPGGGAAIASGLQEITDLPVRYLVNTHGHDDHIWGNQEFAGPWSDVRIVAHALAVEQIRTETIPGLANTLANLDQGIARRQQQLDAGVTESGAQLAAEAREALAARIEQFRRLRDDFRGIRPTPPELAFERRLEIDLGGRRVEVLYCGRGHTAGDVAVWVPDQRVLVAGDLVTAPFPAVGVSFVRDWPETLRCLRRLEPAAIVPGHGPARVEPDFVDQLVALFDSLARRANEVMAAGKPLEEALATVELAEERRALVGDDPAAKRAFDRFFRVPALTALYQEP